MADVQYKDYIIKFKLFDGTTRNIPIRIPLGEKGEPFRYEDFTPEQLEALRGPEGKTPNAVLYSAQNLTPEQKAQARENIGVGGSAFDPTAYGLPVLYLTGDTTGMSKETAVSLDYVYGERSGTATVKWQGSSSLAYPKKNYTIKFDNAFEAAAGWGDQKKYCLKANYIDHSHARNVVSAKLWGQIVKSRPKISPSNVNLFDISKITHFTNQNGDTIDWTTVTNGFIRIASYAYNSGYNYAIGQMYSEGEYTISFDVVNETAATIESLIVGFGANDKNCEVWQTVNDNLQTTTHFEFTVTNTVPNAYFFVVPSNASAAVGVCVTNINIFHKAETNLFDFSKITHFTNNAGETIDWAYKNGEWIRVISAASLSGYPFIMGQTYDEGEYTISFDAHNSITSDTNNINALIVGFGKQGSGTCEKSIDFTTRGEWTHFDVSITNTVADANLFLSGYTGVGSMQSDIHFRDIQVFKQGGDGVTNITYNLSELVNGGAIDGFPVVIMLNGNFHGLYTFNIPKDGWMMGMGEGENEAILCADYSDACEFKGEATLNGDFDLEYVSDENNAAWVTTSVNRLINACMSSDGTDLDTTISQYLDWESAIDYFIFKNLLNGIDMGGKNYILATYDGVKWFYSAYDMDCVYGLDWDGKRFFSANYGKPFASGHTVDSLIMAYKKDTLKARYKELRSGVMSDDNVTTMFLNFIGGIPSTVYAEEAKKWATIPNTATNNVAQIIDYYTRRAKWLDDYIESME